MRIGPYTKPSVRVEIELVLGQVMNKIAFI
jgi:hypothetical protein